MPLDPITNASVRYLPPLLLVEHRAKAAALVPLDLFRKRPFCGAITATASMTFGYSVIFLVPLVWQSSRFLTPQTAGLALTPCGRCRRQE